MAADAPSDSAARRRRAPEASPTEAAPPQRGATAMAKGGAPSPSWLSPVAVAAVACLATLAAVQCATRVAGALADPRLCDVASGCTVAQLQAKRTPSGTRPYSFSSVQEAWGLQDVELHHVVERVLGAHDGKTHDPTYPLYQAGACGAAFEGYEPSLERFEANLAPFAPRVKAIKEYARPDTFAAKLAGAGVTPANLDVLKIDIDGFDLGLARAALDAGYRPKVVLMEINSDYPPPFIFEVQYNPGWGLFWRDGFYGASIAAIADTFEPLGYSIALVELHDPEHNVILVRDDLVHKLPDAPRDVCTVFARGMRDYHCIHVCWADDNFADFDEKFDTTKVWQDRVGNASVEAVLADLHSVTARAADEHQAAVGGHDLFRLGVLPYLNVTACGLER